jgi:hypothetical protein
LLPFNTSGWGGGTFLNAGDAITGAGIAYGGGGKGGGSSPINGFAGAAGVVIVEW